MKSMKNGDSVMKSMRKWSGRWMRLCDCFDGATSMDVDTALPTGLLDRMQEHIDKRLQHEMVLIQDVWNVYFLTLLKCQADGHYLPVSFPRFWWKGSLGGWPIMTFVLQMASCLTVLEDSLTRRFCNRLEYRDWAMLLPALFMSWYLHLPQVWDIYILEMKLQWYLDRKRESKGRLYSWLTPDRERACRMLIILKSVVILSMFLVSLVVLIMKRQAMSYLQNLTLMLLVQKQSLIAFDILAINNMRSLSGYRQALYTRLADFNFQTIIATQTRPGQDIGRLWRFMRFVWLLFVLYAINRFPLLHDLTFGRLNLWECGEIECHS